ncbi:hypothetical protein scyTo_0010020, partial [Scyliorhinus torazame]|nr:hypothetical protein [Scyliorhinus torazame]
GQMEVEECPSAAMGELIITTEMAEADGPIEACDLTQEPAATQENSDLLEMAQVLSEIAMPSLTESHEVETEEQADPLAERSERHALVLSTLPQDSLELQMPQEVILELANGIKMYGKDLATITELLHPTQVPWAPEVAGELRLVQVICCPIGKTFLILRQWDCNLI